MRFFMLDRIIEWEIGERAKAIKNVSLSEDFFDDHFPRHPIMPGVLVIEALAQLSGLLLEATVERDQKKKVKALLTLLEKVKFRNISKPGDTLILNSEIVSLHEDSGKVKTIAKVDEKVIAETGMIFVWVSLEDPELEKKRQQLLDFWLQGLK
ncbi:MAG: 3-hydroxyacyl-ACP dehydratase FabZ [Candidatus Aminicenantes bacterium]|nr:MAG: 3-hydroxyacyl-ACP dehydratase FabZ [Candidatus Aminicenantes bacterium]